MSSRAFTLIELLVVIAIIAVLMGLLFPALIAARNKSRMTEARQAVAQLVSSLEAYQNEDRQKRYPGPFDAANPFSPTATTYFRYQEPGDPRRAFSVAFFDERAGSRIDGVLTILDKHQLPLPRRRVDESDGDMRLLDPWGNPYHYRLGLSKATRAALTCPHKRDFPPLLGDWNWNADDDRESLRNGRDPDLARPYPYVYSWGPDGTATDPCTWIYQRDQR